MIFGFRRGCQRVPNTSCFALPGLSAETALMALDLDGVCGLLGLGLFLGQGGELACARGDGRSLRSWPNAAIRVSLGWSTTRRRY